MKNATRFQKVNDDNVKRKQKMYNGEKCRFEHRMSLPLMQMLQKVILLDNPHPTNHCGHCNVG